MEITPKLRAEIDELKSTLKAQNIQEKRLKELGYREDQIEEIWTLALVELEEELGEEVN